MRAAGVLAVVVLTMVCSGQEPPSQARPVAAKRLELSAVPKIESLFEQRLKDLDATDPFDRLGACSGVYLSGYGLVFTIPLSLVAYPTFGPFTGGFTPQKAEAIHKRKLAHLPALRKAMREMLIEGARAFPALPPNEKIVVAARLFYLEYEDKTGLPNQMVIAADRASALAGNIQPPEEQ
jgi:hypothetical protein